MMPCSLEDRYRCSGKLLPPSSGYNNKPRGKRLSVVCGGSTENGAVSELMGDIGPKVVCLGMKLMGDIGPKVVCLGMKSYGENSVKKTTHPAQDQLKCENYCEHGNETSGPIKGREFPE